MNVPTGYTALDFVGFTDKGTYASNVYYVKNDIVHYGGNLWRCKVDDTVNVTPEEGTSWTVFVGEPTNLVERIIAPLEENPATVAYATGRQIIYDDWLWEVIDDIAVGDVLVDYAVDPTNANIKKADPVETQLLAIKAKEGNLTNLTTTAKADLVSAINEVDGEIGNLSSLDTTVKTSAVAAINEVNTKVSKTEVLASNAQQMIAPIQTTLTASKAYAVGEQFVYNGLLYKATATIAQGNTITIGGNAELADSVTEQLINAFNTLNAKFNSYYTRYIADGRNGISFESGMVDAIVTVEFGLNPQYMVQFYICGAMVSQKKRLLNGAYRNSTDNHLVAVEYNSSGISLISWTYNGTDIAPTTPCKMTIYERY